MKQYFAKLDENNVVLSVVHKHDELTRQSIIESLKKEFNHPYWIAADPNSSFRRGGVPSKHWKFDPTKNAFIPPRPFPSWTIGENDIVWSAPVTKPEETETERYIWNEETYYETGTGWVLITS